MLCSGCNYPIPSWQHQGACKPVAEKVPPIQERDPFAPRLHAPRRTGRTRQTTATATEETVTPADETVTRGNKRYGSPAERQRAYRARKRQSG